MHSVRCEGGGDPIVAAKSITYPVGILSPKRHVKIGGLPLAGFWSDFWVLDRAFVRNCRFGIAE
jgi:hypothetical protein